MEVVQALSFGPDAAALVGRRSEVAAVLSNAIYLAAGEALVGVVGARGADGPISLRVRGLDRLLRSGVRAGTQISATAASIEIGQLARIDLHNAIAWHPNLPTIVAPANERKQAAAKLLAAIEARSVGAGFGQFAAALAAIAEGKEPDLAGNLQLQRAALTGVSALANALNSGQVEQAAAAATSLLGLGPGLTPSADDFLCALLASARWRMADHPSASLIATQLAPAIVTAASKRTTRLSARLLHHAANGLLYSPALALGDTLRAGRGDEIPVTAPRLFELGHTSGVDMACGLLFAALLLR